MNKIDAQHVNFFYGDFQALKDISMAIEEKAVVAFIGPSGCGKTTLLNIIGGLDQYTSGDLVIRGISTKDYDDRDWDVYRNHRIGFVFQSYNLIPQQSVLENVEIALTIAGCSKAERKKRAANIKSTVMQSAHAFIGDRDESRSRSRVQAVRSNLPPELQRKLRGR